MTINDKKITHNSFNEEYLYYRLDEGLARLELERWATLEVPSCNVDCGEIDLALPALSLGGVVVPNTILSNLRQAVDRSLEEISGLEQGSDNWKYAYSHKVGKALHAHLHIIRGEVESIEVWQFIGLRVLPAAAFVRFGTENLERHLGNLRRHVLRRVWMSYDLLGQIMDEGGQLSEDDLNQILDRTHISSNKVLALSLARIFNRIENPSKYGIAGVNTRDIKRKIAEEVTAHMGVSMLQAGNEKNIIQELELIKRQVLLAFGANRVKLF